MHFQLRFGRHIETACRLSVFLSFPADLHKGVKAGQAVFVLCMPQLIPGFQGREATETASSIIGKMIPLLGPRVWGAGLGPRAPSFLGAIPK